MKYYRCGTVLKTHGLKGEMKVKSYSDFDRFYKGARIFFKIDNEYYEEHVLKSKIVEGYYMIALEGKEDINLIEKYHSKDIYVSDFERLNELEDDEYYYSDLVGKNVYNDNNELKGVVVEVREYPKSHYLVVRNDGKDYLVPFIKVFIKEVTKDKIVINEIEGLF